MSRLVIHAVAIASLGLFLTWLVLGESSPAANWVVVHPLLTNLASAANLPAMLFALGSFGGAAPTAALVVAVMVLQWLVYGLALAWLYGRLWPNHSFKSTLRRGAARFKR
ncbi:hypothetical protein CH92_17615 [Stutzerimonas stutzeri]|uniref:Uncharacterized protein n=1 Tax=Stutzerimonas stutzeri TaxID=316 RepID=W8R4V0_STUST|nr:hypothetical protein CH92_17615 [Stutzerimonas stutzeri]